MLIQIRCYTCGKIIGHVYEEYKTRVDTGENPATVLDELGLTRYCCRRMIVTYVEVLAETMQYQTSRGQVTSRR